jgi:hypothetical protein
LVPSRDRAALARRIDVDWLPVPSPYKIVPIQKNYFENDAIETGDHRGRPWTRQLESAVMKLYGPSSAKILNVVRIICDALTRQDAIAAGHNELALGDAKHVRMRPFGVAWSSYVAVSKTVHFARYPVHRQQVEN